MLCVNTEPLLFAVYDSGECSNDRLLNSEERAGMESTDDVSICFPFENSLLNIHSLVKTTPLNQYHALFHEYNVPLEALADVSRARYFLALPTCYQICPFALVGVDAVICYCVNCP